MDSQATMIIFSVMLVAFILACLVSIIPLWIGSIINNRYLWNWSGRKREVVFFRPKVLEWAHYDYSNNKNYQVLQMRYADIVRIEYDSEQRLLRVYGPVETKEWDSIERTRCVEVIKRDSNIAADALWFTLPDYFDDFEEMKAQLVERTGLEIMECNRKFA